MRDAEARGMAAENEVGVLKDRADSSSIAMHDIRWIRDNPDAFDRALARRGLEPRGEAS